MGLNLKFSMEYAMCSFIAVEALVHRQGFIWKDFLKIVEIILVLWDKKKKGEQFESAILQKFVVE